MSLRQQGVAVKLSPIDDAQSGGDEARSVHTVQLTKSFMALSAFRS